MDDLSDGLIDDFSVYMSDGTLAELEALLDSEPRIATDWVARFSRDKLVHLAAKYGDADKLSLVLRHGADPIARGDDGMTPLHGAAFHGNASTGYLLVRVLRGSRSALDALDDDGRTPLYWAINDQSRGSEGAAEIIGHLIREGATFDIPSAISVGQTALVHDRLAATGMPPAPVAADWLDQAVSRRLCEIAELLLERGALACALAGGHNPLYWLIDKPDMTGLLLRYGADPTVRGAKDELTPLDHARTRGYAPVLAEYAAAGYGTGG